MLYAMKESRPEVGSSRTMTEGSVMSSTPIDVLLRSPPEMVFLRVVPQIVFSTLLRPRSFMSY